MFQIKGNGTLSVDNIVFDNCQCENAAHFIYLDTTGGYSASGFTFTLTLRDCVCELGADIYLGNKCHLLSRGNRFSTYVYVDSADVTIDSESDWFVDTGPYTFAFLTGSQSQILNYAPGPQPDSTIPGAIVGGRLQFAKLTTGIANATPTSVAILAVPNAGLAEVVEVTVLGSIGAGGAVGDHEDSASNTYHITITRTSGAIAVGQVSTAFGASTAAVPGATTVACTVSLSAATGGAGQVNYFHIKVTITKGGGSSANHTCFVSARCLNAGASRVRIN